MERVRPWIGSGWVTDFSHLVGWVEWVVKKVDWVGLDPAILDYVHL